MADAERVSFLIAGVQKGGTTALYDYLGEAAEVSMSFGKEPHFFDDETQDWAAPDVAAYHAQFAPFDGRIRGEATPIYTYWPGSLERIYAYNPAVKLIVMLRDPVQRAWSHWRMEYARKVETRPFSWCIRQGRQRLFDAEPWGFHRDFSYVERGFYGEQVAAALSVFPRNQVLILTSDALRRDLAGTLGKVRGFLGLADAPAPAARESNVGRQMDYGGELTAADITHLRSVYGRDAERLADLTGLRFG